MILSIPFASKAESDFIVQNTASSWTHFRVFRLNALSLSLNTQFLPSNSEDLFEDY